MTNLVCKPVGVLTPLHLTASDTICHKTVHRTFVDVGPELSPLFTATNNPVSAVEDTIFLFNYDELQTHPLAFTGSYTKYFYTKASDSVTVTIMPDNTPLSLDNAPIFFPNSDIEVNLYEILFLSCASANFQGGIVVCE